MTVKQPVTKNASKLLHNTPTELRVAHLSRPHLIGCRTKCETVTSRKTVDTAASFTRQKLILKDKWRLGSGFSTLSQYKHSLVDTTNTEFIDLVTPFINSAKVKDRRDFKSGQLDGEAQTEMWL